MDLFSNSLMNFLSQGCPSIAGLEAPPPEELEEVELVGVEETDSLGLPPPPLLVEKLSQMEQFPEEPSWWGLGVGPSQAQN